MRCPLVLLLAVVASTKVVSSSAYRQPPSLSEELQSTDWLDYPETLPLQHQHLHNHKYTGRQTFHGPQREEILSRPSPFWPGLPMDVPSSGNRPSRQNRPDGNLGLQTQTSGSFRPGGPPGGFRPPFNRDDDDDEELFVFDRPTSPGASSGLVDGRPDGRPTRTTRPTARPSTRMTVTTSPSSVTSTTQNICTTNCPVTNEFNPVCGTDQVTYGNPGKLNCAVNCGRMLVGLCGAKPRPPGKTLTECIPADIDCREDMGLVCGIDESGLLRTFPSQCQMEFSNCADKTYYAFFREGEC